MVLTGEQVLCKMMVTLKRIPEDPCFSSVLTLMASLVAFICKLEEGTAQGLCQGFRWLLHLLSPGSWGFWSPLALVQTCLFAIWGQEMWWSSKQPCPARSLDTWVVKCSEFLGEGGYGVSGGPRRAENWVLGRGQGWSPQPSPAGGDPHLSLPALRAPPQRRGKESKSSLQKPLRSWRPSRRRWPVSSRTRSAPCWGRPRLISAGRRRGEPSWPSASKIWRTSPAPTPSTSSRYLRGMGRGEGADNVAFWGFVLFHVELGARSPGTRGLPSHSPIGTVFSPPRSRGDQAAKTFSSITPTSILAVTQAKLMCCPGWVPRCGGQKERGWGAPLSPSSIPPSLAAQQEETFLGGDAAPREAGTVWVQP